MEENDWPDAPSHLAGLFITLLTSYTAKMTTQRACWWELALGGFMLMG